MDGQLSTLKVFAVPKRFDFSFNSLSSDNCICISGEYFATGYTPAANTITIEIRITQLQTFEPLVITSKNAIVSNPVPSGVSLDPETGKLWALTKPDYTNERSTAVIDVSGQGSEKTGSWVADQNGWVRVSASGNVASAGAWYSVTFSVNSRVVHAFSVTPPSTGGSFPTGNMFPASKGDTVSSWHNGTGWTTLSSQAYFMPDRNTAA
jgi:hypothetical protein